MPDDVSSNNIKLDRLTDEEQLSRSSINPQRTKAQHALNKKKARQSSKPRKSSNCPWKNLRDKDGQRSNARMLSDHFIMQKHLTMRQQQKALTTFRELETTTSSQA